MLMAENCTISFLVTLHNTNHLDAVFKRKCFFSSFIKNMVVRSNKKYFTIFLFFSTYLAN